MDSLTQAVLGACVVEAALGKKLGNRAVGWGVFFGTLPDLDVVPMRWMDPVDALEWHRGLSHGIPMWFLGALVGGGLLWRIHRLHGVRFAEAAWAVFLAWSTHVLIDVFTVYGTQIFEPFSKTRFATNNMFIIDPLFTMPMLLGLLVLLFFGRGSKARRTANAAGLGLACAYAGWSFAAKALAERGFAASMAEHGIRVERWMTSPMLATTVFWRALVWDGEVYWIAYTNVLRPENGTGWTRVEPGHEHLRGIEGDRAVAQLRWFSGGYYAVRRIEGGALMFSDLRMGETRPVSDPGLAHPPFVFNWVLEPGSDGVRWHQVWGGGKRRWNTLGLWAFLWRTI